jgi:hypothetical protein
LFLGNPESYGVKILSGGSRRFLVLPTAGSSYNLSLLIWRVPVRMCPKCRLITSSDPVCAECGWSVAAAGPAGADLAPSQARLLQSLVLFSAAMFGTALVLAFMTTQGNRIIPDLSGGIFTAGLIADLWLIRLIHRAAGRYQEAMRWTVGAVLTFPFGTLVFAWLLARRLRLDKQPPPA